MLPEVVPAIPSESVSETQLSRKKRKARVQEINGRIESYQKMREVAHAMEDSEALETVEKRIAGLLRDREDLLKSDT